MSKTWTALGFLSQTNGAVRHKKEKNLQPNAPSTPTRLYLSCTLIEFEVLPNLFCKKFGILVSFLGKKRFSRFFTFGAALTNALRILLQSCFSIMCRFGPRRPNLISTNVVVRNSRTKCINANEVGATIHSYRGANLSELQPWYSEIPASATEYWFFNSWLQRPSKIPGHFCRKLE